jgi:hypothetical protein
MPDLSKHSSASPAFSFLLGKSNRIRAPEIDRLLAPLRRLLDDRLFWQYQSDGLTLFSRPGWCRVSS